MKATKIIGVLFIVIGLVFAILVTIKYITEKDERIYTTAYIVRIDEQETGNPEFPTDYTTYVEIEVNGENITTKLNTYKPSFKIGKQIDVYYFENDMQTAYEDGSDVFYIIFSLSGVIFAAIGTILVFRKNKYSIQK